MNPNYGLTSVKIIQIFNVKKRRSVTEINRLMLLLLLPNHQTLLLLPNHQTLLLLLRYLRLLLLPLPNLQKLLLLLRLHHHHHRNRRNHDAPMLPVDILLLQ
jgi:hypothetical protein